ncbi:MAG: aminoacyltransferase [Streptococcaceae bacterium]|nr:aminoacyltransferase [Streptococcaceae bacterium]
MKKYVFKEIDLTEFEKSAQGIGYLNFLQTAAMARVFADRNYQLHYFVGFENDEVKLLALLTAVPIFGGLKFELRFGPSFLDNEGSFDEALFFQFLNYLKNYVKSSNGLILKVIPDLEFSSEFLKKMSAQDFVHTSPESGYDEGEPTWHYVKELTGLSDAKALMKSYSKDGQYSVKRTQQFGISVRALAYDELSKFKSITEATSERRGYNDHDLEYYQVFYKAFADKAQFLVAEINFQDYVSALKEQIAKLQSQIDNSNSLKKEKQRQEWQSQIQSQEKRLEEVAPFLEKYQDKHIILAGGLFVENDKEMIYLFSGSYEEFKHFYAPFAIQHFIMTQALEKKIPLYNFYGITGNFDGSDGVLHFKENFNGHPVRKIGSFCYYPHPLKHQFIQFVKKILRRT